MYISKATLSIETSFPCTCASVAPHQVENLEPTLSINHNWTNGFGLLATWNLTPTLTPTPTPTLTQTQTSP